jgi:thiol peroxidase
LEVLVNGESIELKNRDRKVGSEAPASRVEMLSGETKVIGMMADRVQVMITLANCDDLTDGLLKVITKHSPKTYIYIMASTELDTKYDAGMTSLNIKDFTLKYGVNINDNLCAKSIFIIDKEGEIVYKELLADLLGEFDLEEFDQKLSEAISFKKKGHTHENWMGV